MKVQDVVNKCFVGVSPLTGKLYVYYSNNKEKYAKYKKELTSNKEETKKALAFMLNQLED